MSEKQGQYGTILHGWIPPQARIINEPDEDEIIVGGLVKYEFVETSHGDLVFRLVSEGGESIVEFVYSNGGKMEIRSPK